MSERTAVVDVFCLPCAGASAAMYLRWRRLLPEWLRIRPLELPGRGSRMDQACEEDFQTLVARICDDLPDDKSSRWALLGHSMGALLAFGVAQRLRTLGMLLPSVLLVSGSPAPSRRDPDRFPDTRDDQALISDLRRQGGTPPEVFRNPEMLRMTLDVLGADYRVCGSFRYRQTAPLPMPIHAFAGRHDEIAVARMEAWQTETESEFLLHWFNGGHFFIQQYEADVLRVLTTVLRATIPTASPATV